MFTCTAIVFFFAFLAFNPRSFKTSPRRPDSRDPVGFTYASLCQRSWSWGKLCARDSWVKEHERSLNGATMNCCREDSTIYWKIFRYRLSGLRMSENNEIFLSTWCRGERKARSGLTSARMYQSALRIRTTAPICTSLSSHRIPQIAQPKFDCHSTTRVRTPNWNRANSPGATGISGIQDKHYPLVRRVYPLVPATESTRRTQLVHRATAPCPAFLLSQYCTIFFSLNSSQFQ